MAQQPERRAILSADFSARGRDRVTILYSVINCIAGKDNARNNDKLRADAGRKEDVGAESRLMIPEARD